MFGWFFYQICFLLKIIYILQILGYTCGLLWQLLHLFSELDGDFPVTKSVIYKSYMGNQNQQRQNLYHMYRKKITFHTQNHIPQKSRKSADNAYKHNIKPTYYPAETKQIWKEILGIQFFSIKMAFKCCAKNWNTETHTKVLYTW